MVSQLIVSLKKSSSIYGSRVKILSPAKLNLYLNILGKYPNNSKFFGYHKIESIIERISFFDEIYIEVKRKADIALYSNNKYLVAENNLCLKAVKLIKKIYKIPYGFKIFLKKNIPVGAGLGGGSSNAASTLLGINALLNLKLSLAELYNCGQSLGSDVNFFLSQSPFAVVRGRGEKIEPFCGKILQHFIIWPKINLSTAAVYETFNMKLTKFLSNVNILKYAITKGDLSLVQKNLYNALEKTASFICRPIKDIKAYFEKKGFHFLLTGSGSALFCIIEKKVKFPLATTSDFKFFYAKTF
ncbi:MAG: 4-(cytidine 5'-diphospho)-2-C-methyl-D-erythritol kinase [Candidatus Omnitrophica bacterium]|nr:4-(cytidine 5'-diphospho)-2-C-methyl-D-erythritol kinase [Candidatus Omnitrophota bacterium]